MVNVNIVRNFSDLMMSKLNVFKTHAENVKKDLKTECVSYVKKDKNLMMINLNV